MEKTTLWARANGKCPNRYWFQLADVPAEEALSAQRRDFIEDNKPDPPTVIKIVSEVNTK